MKQHQFQPAPTLLELDGAEGVALGPERGGGDEQQELVALRLQDVVVADVYAQVLVEAEPAPLLVREDPGLLEGGAGGGMDALHLGEGLVVGQLDGHPVVVDEAPVNRTQPRDWRRRETICQLASIRVWAMKVARSLP